MNRLYKSMTVAVLAILLVGAIAGSGSFVSASDNSPSVNKPVFAWMFGYTGNAFYPQSQVGVSPSTYISIVKQISGAVGKSNLRIVGALGLEGGSVSPGMYTTERNFVGALKQYASYVYARIDLLTYNMNTKPSIMSAASVFIRTLGANGLWLDEGPNLICKTGASGFNKMMQSLANAFPGISFLINQSVNKCGWITPGPGTSWGRNAYIAVSVNSGSCCSINYGMINTVERFYPGRVLLHFDAFAKVKTEPMGIFAGQGASQELSEIRSLASAAASHNFDFLFPTLGAWTYMASQYHGTMYNSLSTGKFARGTFGSYLADMRSV